MPRFRRLFFLLLLFMVVFPITSQADNQWIVQEIKELKAIFPNPDDVTIIDMEFPAHNIGMLIAKGANNSSSVFRTIDGGNTWSRVWTYSASMKYNDIVFDETGNFGVVLFEQKVYIGGNWYTYQGVQVTTDMGNSWVLRYLPAGGWIHGVEARWPGYIWAVGENSRILYSTNWGQNWSSITSPVSGNTFLDIYINPASQGWGLILGSANLYASNAYGGSWVDTQADIPNMDSVDFSLTHGVGIKNTFDQYGTIYYSGYPPEGGVYPWTAATLPEELVPYDIDMVTTWQGWVAGRNSLGMIRGKIYKTEDYGQTWSIDLDTNDLTGDNPHLYNICMVQQGPVINEGYAAGSGYWLFKYGPQVFQGFIDVPSGHWAEEAIYKIYDAGITQGCSQNPLMYCPENTVTRTQMAVFLGRAKHGSSFTPPSATGIFSDVPVNYWAADWIEQFYNDGITSGCGTNPPRYCPYNPVTRTQMAVFLLRVKHGDSYTPPAATGIFDDVPLSHWAVDWIEQLYNEGITTGCGTGPLRYCPENSVTRAQMAVFIMRTFGL